MVPNQAFPADTANNHFSDSCYTAWMH